VAADEVAEAGALRRVPVVQGDQVGLVTLDQVHGAGVGEAWHDEAGQGGEALLEVQAGAHGRRRAGEQLEPRVRGVHRAPGGRLLGEEALALGRRLVARRDVGRHPDEPGDVVPGPDGLAVALDPPGRAVRAEDAVLHVEVGALRDRPLHDGHDPVPVTGVEEADVGVGGALEGAGLESRQRLHVGVPLDQVGGAVPLPHAEAAGAERELEPLLAPPLRVRQPAALADVLRHLDDAGERTAGVDRRARHAREERPPVAAGEDDVTRPRRPCQPAGAGSAAVRGGHDLHQRPAQHLRRPPAVQRLGAAVPGPDGAGGVGDDDGLHRRIGRRLASGGRSEGGGRSGGGVPGGGRIDDVSQRSLSCHPDDPAPSTAPSASVTATHGDRQRSRAPVRLAERLVGNGAAVETNEHKVLVTGASRGIGLAIALELAAAGFEVVAGVRDDDGASGVSTAAATRGVDVRTVTLDVTDEEACRRVVDAERPWGLVNNAGYAQSGAVTEVADDDARAQLETLVLAPVRLARLACPTCASPAGAAS
jgi:hypothetical protein